MLNRLNLRTRLIALWLILMLPAWLLAGYFIYSGLAKVNEFDVVVLVCLVTAVGMLFSYWNFLATRQEFLNIAQAAQSLANDNYGVRLPVQREGVFLTVALSVNRLARELFNTKSRVEAATSELENAAEELVKLATGSRQGSHEQSEAVALIAGAVEQMRGSIATSAETVNHAATIAVRSTALATDSNAKVNDLSGEIESVYAIVSSASNAVDALGERSKLIGRIIEVIQSIADQTNLLALNAAIESARAGEHGRGFSVVAEEVRGLAKRTTESSAEIGKLIRDMQDDVSAIVDQMKGIKQSVVNGVMRTEEVTNVLKHIQMESGVLRDNIDQLAHALVEQQKAGQEVAQQMERINTRAQHHDQEIEHTHSTAMYLNRLSGNLKDVYKHGRET